MGGTGQYVEETVAAALGKQIRVGKVFTFEAAHFIPNHPKCGATHGHTYKVEVVIRGTVETATGMVVDLHELSEDVHKIIDNFDHVLLNDSVSFIPTCENIAIFIRDLLHIDYCVEYVKVQEGEGGFAIA
jgi:6-pyruvoyltetrahydropterin/6-carboxytetrahydropterin synthase